MAHVRTNTRRCRGVAAVEFAIVLTLLITIVFGITELGRALFLYDGLTKSARSAARYLAVYDSTSDSLVRDRAACIAVYGTPNCSGTPVIPDFATSHVRLDDPTTDPTLLAVPAAGGTSGTLDLVRVTISGYRFTSLVPHVVPDIPFGPIVAHMPKSVF